MPVISRSLTSARVVYLRWRELPRGLLARVAPTIAATAKGKRRNRPLRRPKIAVVKSPASSAPVARFVPQ